jgi:hypothetical protein
MPPIEASKGSSGCHAPDSITKPSPKTLAQPAPESPEKLNEREK